MFLMPLVLVAMAWPPNLEAPSSASDRDPAAFLFTIRANRGAEDGHVPEHEPDGAVIAVRSCSLHAWFILS
jgi:hypothetical protein